MEYRSNKLVKNPLVSIFIFVYNREKMVVKAIESILAQKTAFPFEIVIAEDHSIDKTKEVCLEYFNKHPEKIVLIANDINKGQVRNVYESTIQYARGKYIARCDDDDWWIDEYKIQKQIDILENNKEYDMVYTKARMYIQSSSKFKRHPMGNDRTQFERMIVSNGVPALTACYSKQAFLEYIKEIRPLEKTNFGEDWPLWIWFSFRKKIYFLDEVTAVYRLQKESDSNTQDPLKNYKITVAAHRNVQIFFYNYFNVSNKHLLDKIYLAYYIRTMRLEPARIDSIERNKLFIQNHFYGLFILSNLYTLCGKNRLLNNAIFLLERILRKIGLLNDKKL